MPFDGIFTHTMVAELNEQLATGRIAKIFQPFQNELVLTIRANRKNRALLLSAHPSYARVQITEQSMSNPATPSNFVMSLRKHLDGAILLRASQVNNDRIINLHFTHRNELGDQEEIILAIELMGRRSNIILFEQNSNRIIDTIKHIGADQNRYRLLLPGATYITPPAQNKLNPFETDLSEFKNLIAQFPNFEVLSDQLRSKFQGFSKESSLELAYRFISNTDIKDVLDTFLNELSQSGGYMLKDNSVFTSFMPTYLVSMDHDINKYNLLSEELDDFYRSKAQRDRVQQQGHNLIRVVNNELKKNRKKLVKLEKTLAATQRADEYRIKGEILTTYLSQVQRGMDEISLPNYYDNDQPIKIVLSNQLSPSKNAQKYFTRYQKEKNAVKFVNEQINKTKSEISFLDNIQTQIELAKPEDLDEIRLELEEQGYIRKNNSKKKRIIIKSKPEVYVVDDTRILVGKNDTQNDQLTMKTAKKNQYWLHTKDIPGSHVIIESENPSNRVIEAASQLAAYFSKARNSANVPVDMVQVRNIRKPNGAKPGFVIYEGQTTLRVTPDAKLISEMTK